MSSEYRNNHYVPIWYQKRFLPRGRRDNELVYLNLNPHTTRDSKGGIHHHRAVRRLGFKHCFAEQDLYTTRFGPAESTRIEQMFFGNIDSKGHDAVEYWTNFAHPSVNKAAFHDVLMFMSTQKLRTPKGLGWLAIRARADDRDAVLRHMLVLRQLHCAIWTECVWAIADCEESETKFIVSDHPVTVYNRRCGPRSQWCRGNEDPDINLNATHTIFPLTFEKMLILTNLSWVRNPYQSEIGVRPNPHPWRTAMFNFMEIQTMRHLSEPEVREINFIIKSRALRYVAAADEEWLYPEKYVSKANWNTFGDGYLLMPDPRGITFTQGIMIGHNDGTATAFDAYGRRPGQPGFERESKGMDEWNTFHRFQGEFARLYGPSRRGRSFSHARFEPERDDDEYHRYHLSLEAKHRKK
jgi:hypothetical protein